MRYLTVYIVFNRKLLGTADGSNTHFSFASVPTATSADYISVYSNGILQTPSGVHTSQDYSVTGSDVYFTSASIPPASSILLANYYE